jgi:glycosyl transferase family 1
VKVYVVPSDAFGCGHYRMIWPANVLQREGWDVQVLPPKRDSGFMVKVQDNPDGTQTLLSTKVPEDADVIVLQRPAHPLQPQLIRMLRSNKIAVVVDMDDDMSSIHPDNIAFHTYRPTSHSPLSWKWAVESCKQATLVTTSTKALQRVYAKHGRGMVLDNYVPEVYLRFDRSDSGAFGWAGTTKSHPNDLQITGNTVERLMGEGYDFKVVGGRSKVKECLRLKEVPSVTGSIPLAEWAKHIGQHLDVGMAPLAPTAFNTAKSRLKAIEYMAVGVPWVGSPREEYRRLHRESGCGLLADTPKDWYSKLKQLLTDETMRKEQAAMGMEYMEGQTYQANAWRWAEAWTRALEIERA